MKFKTVFVSVFVSLLFFVSVVFASSLYFDSIYSSFEDRFGGVNVTNLGDDKFVYYVLENFVDENISVVEEFDNVTNCTVNVTYSNPFNYSAYRTYRVTVDGYNMLVEVVNETRV